MSYAKGQTVRFHSSYPSEGVITGKIVKVVQPYGHRTNITYAIRDENGGINNYFEESIVEIV